MIRIGVFGGTFDPPHLGHRALAEIAHRELQLDTVLWIPAAISPHKISKKMADTTHRLEMVRLTIEGQSFSKLDTRELEREPPSFTVDTLESLREEYPTASIHLIMGGDSFSSFSTWKSPERIRELAQLVVYRRKGKQEPVELQPTDFLLPGDFIPLSSTEIRRSIEDSGLIGKGNKTKDVVEEAPANTPGITPDITPKVVPEVARYIKTHRLYLRDESTSAH